MRSLTQPRLLAISVPVGLGLALLCVPLILAETASGRVRAAQLAVLPLLCVFLLQAALAWAPEEMRRLPDAGGSKGQGHWSELVVLALAMTLLQVATDVWLRGVLFVPEIRDWLSFWRKLPFVCLVQPLFLVLAVYAFGRRLGGQPRVACAAVLLVHQVLVLLQFGRRVDAGALALLLLVAGFQGLVAAVALTRCGAGGPVVLASAGFGRQVAYLLMPALGTWGTT